PALTANSPRPFASVTFTTLFVVVAVRVLTLVSIASAAVPNPAGAVTVRSVAVTFVAAPFASVIAPAWAVRVTGPVTVTSPLGLSTPAVPRVNPDVSVNASDPAPTAAARVPTVLLLVRANAPAPVRFRFAAVTADPAASDTPPVVAVSSTVAPAAATDCPA